MRWSPGRAAGSVSWLADATLLFPGCRPRPAHAVPSIELTQIPPADAGGTPRQGTIAGQPFTAIQPDSTWTSSTHLGTEYAALLVEPSYRPAAVVSTLPGIGAGVAGVAAAEGVPAFWRMRRFLIRQKLGDGESTRYRVSVAGMARRLHPIVRDEVYRVGREAVANAFRRAGAQGIEVEIAYSAKAVRLLVRDDGRGIDADVLDTGTGACGGLSGMRERASRIGAELRVRSRAGIGTEVELSVPASVAFQEAPSGVRRKETRKWRNRAPSVS